MKNKKGIELGINFIVVLILAVAVFVLGVAFIFNALNNANDLLDRAKPRINEELDKKIANGEIFAIYPTSFELRRGEPGIFGIAWFNGASDKYLGANITVSDKSRSWKMESQPYFKFNFNKFYTGRVPSGETEKLLLLFRVDSKTPDGTYILNIQEVVSDDGTTWVLYAPEQLKKIYVTVS
jgi:hypothetical protein